MNLTINILQTDFSTESALVVDTNGIIVDGVAINTGGGSSSEVVVVDDGCPALIQIMQTGFHMYEMTINDVYSADKSIDIVMVPTFKILTTYDLGQSSIHSTTLVASA